MMMKWLQKNLKSLSKEIGFALLSYDSRYQLVLPILILLTDVILSSLIIWKIPYTEIDWVAYMQEVSGVFTRGEYDYQYLAGDTGPLVYPAMFVWIFALLRWITSNGENIVLGQCIFAGIHVLVVAMTLYLHQQSRHPVPWASVLLILSRRIHSIYMLRLFNDCIAVALLYSAICLFVRSRWRLGCVLYSMAVGVKMNILLTAPGLAVLLVQYKGLKAAMGHIFLICAPVQILPAIPFLVENPASYIARSFDLGRMFLYKWTVNFRFLSEQSFTSRTLAITLLVATLTTWVIFGHYRWASANGGLWSLLTPQSGTVWAVESQGLSSKSQRKERKRLRRKSGVSLGEHQDLGAPSTSSLSYSSPSSSSSSHSPSPSSLSSSLSSLWPASSTSASQPSSQSPAPATTPAMTPAMAPTSAPGSASPSFKSRSYSHESPSLNPNASTTATASMTRDSPPSSPEEEAIRRNLNSKDHQSMPLPAVSSTSIDAQHIVSTLFESNFIGIVFARSLHYQFYAWYYHSLPFLTFRATSRAPFALAFILCIEYAFNVYPSTSFSSLLLQLCHVGLLFFLLFSSPKTGPSRGWANDETETSLRTSSETKASASVSKKKNR